MSGNAQITTELATGLDDHPLASDDGGYRRQREPELREVRAGNFGSPRRELLTTHTRRVTAPGVAALHHDQSRIGASYFYKTRVTALEAALQHEHMRSHCEGTDGLLMMHHVDRCTSDSRRMRDRKATQHAAATTTTATDAVRKKRFKKLKQFSALKEATIEELKTAHAAAISRLEATHGTALAARDAIIAKLQAENAALKAQAASKLAEIHAAVTTRHQTLEIYPHRPADGRQFALWRDGPAPPSPHLTFDPAWVAVLNDYRYYRRSSYSFSVDAATGTRLSITGKAERDDPCVTFRSTAPLPRWPLQHRSLSVAGYRIVVETWGVSGYCHLGFIPSHLTDPEDDAISGPIVPTGERDFQDYGGWYVTVAASGSYDVHEAQESGWVPLLPAPPADVDCVFQAVGNRFSSYATTDKLPPVPAGSALEFAVDYAAGTCRVALYTPEAVAGGFAEAPHAKMELRFVATPVEPNWPIPARPVPTAANSRVELYPAVFFRGTGAALRFVA